MMYSNALEVLWQSTVSFHSRFPDAPKSVPVFLANVDEECREFAADITANKREAVDEAADVLVTVIGALWLRGFELYDLEAAIRRVAAKNDAKDHDTHHVIETGKIARRYPKA